LILEITTYKSEIKGVIPAAFLFLLVLAGCTGQNSVKVSEGQSIKDQASVKAGRIVQVGDSADIHYLCKLNTGEVVAATDSVAKDQPKSNLYLVTKETGPVSVTAVSPDEPVPDEKPKTPEEKTKTLEELIRDKLARMVDGMKVGEKRHVQLTAEDIAGGSKGHSISRLARVRTRPKEMNVPIADYKYRTGKSPEVGDSYAYDPAFPGRVESVTEKAAVVRFSAKTKPGDVLETPFGPGLIREDETHYYIDIDARKNALVRAGDLIGRIINVDDKFITVDFGNPFARETMFCDVTVEKITAANPIMSETGK
jgi:FKBP-type peptidyl-prolyl cis-trans isomerase 2